MRYCGTLGHSCWSERARQRASARVVGRDHLDALPALQWRGVRACGRVGYSSVLQGAGGVCCCGITPCSAQPRIVLFCAYARTRHGGYPEYLSTRHMALAYCFTHCSLPAAHTLARSCRARRSKAGRGAPVARVHTHYRAHAQTRTRTHKHTHTHTQTHARTRTRTDTDTHRHTHTHAHTHTHTHKHIRAHEHSVRTGRRMAGAEGPWRAFGIRRRLRSSRRGPPGL